MLLEIEWQKPSKPDVKKLHESIEPPCLIVALRGSLAKKPPSSGAAGRLCLKSLFLGSFPRWFQMNASVLLTLVEFGPSQAP